MIIRYISLGLIIKSARADKAATKTSSTSSNNFLRSENSEADCLLKEGGVWKEVWSFLERTSELKSQSACEGKKDGVNRKWATPNDVDDPNHEECLVMLTAIQCLPAQWTRPNHLGWFDED